MTRKELKDVLTLHKKWLNEEKDGVRANLTGIDLSWIVLDGADFRCAILCDTDFSHAEFRNSNFSGADLSGANLVYADFSYSDFSNANLIDVNLCGADLNNAKLYNAVGLIKNRNMIETMKHNRVPNCLLTGEEYWCLMDHNKDIQIFDGYSWKYCQAMEYRDSYNVYRINPEYRFVENKNE